MADKYKATNNLNNDSTKNVKQLRNLPNRMINIKNPDGIYKNNINSSNKLNHRKFINPLFNPFTNFNNMSSEINDFEDNDHFENNNENIENNDNKSKKNTKKEKQQNNKNDKKKSSNNSKKASGKSNNKKTSGAKNLGKKKVNITKVVGKKYVLIGGAIAFSFIMIMTAIVSAKEFGNLSLTNNSMAGIGGTRECTEEEIENRLVYLGDSRIVGMESSLENNNIEYIAEVGQGYNWLKNTASSELDSIIQNNSNSVIVLGLGVNDLHNIDNYISYYNELIEKYPNNVFFVLSVNPVDEELEASNGYSVKNEDINLFNEKLQSNFSEIYIDSNSTLSTIGSIDGVHYDNETNIEIHDTILSNITSSGNVKCGGGGDLLAKLEELGRWYIDNVNTYTCNVAACGESPFQNCRKDYDNPYTQRAYGDDCTEFVAAYMDYVSGVKITESNSTGMVDPNGSWAKSVAEAGWVAYTSDEVGELQPGDVLIASAGSFYSNKGHHGEVYIDENSSFGWGAVKCDYPSKKSIVKKEYGGHVHFEDSGHDYITIYRYEGGTSEITTTTTSTTNSSGT